MTDTELLYAFCKWKRLKATVVPSSVFYKWPMIIFNDLHSDEALGICENGKYLRVYMFCIKKHYDDIDQVNKECIRDMCGKHFVMFENDYSTEFKHDFIFPSSLEELELKLIAMGD